MPSTARTVSIPTRGIGEPTSTTAGDSGRHRARRLPGNKEFVRGRPDRRGRKAATGRAAARAAPTAAAKTISIHAVAGRVARPVLRGPRTARSGQAQPKDTTRVQAAAGRLCRRPARRPTSMSPRTMRNSMGRRIALSRPKPAEIEALRRERLEEALPSRRRRAKSQRLTLETRPARAAQQDHRLYRPGRRPLSTASTRVPRAERQGGHVLPDGRVRLDGRGEKDLAKRFFVLLHLFLTRRYDRIDIVFIRHTARRRRSTRRRSSTAARPAARWSRPRSRRCMEIARARYPTDRMEHLRARRPPTATITAPIQQPLRLAARRRGPAALPVFRLCRDQRRA